MSKPIVKFLYGADPRESQSSQRTIQRFPGSFMEPQVENMPFGSVVVPPPFNTVPTIPTTQMNSRVSPQPMNRYKSADHFPPLPRSNPITQSNAVMGSREEVPESDIQLFSQKQSSGEPKRGSQMMSEQIVLKAPSYKFTPKRNGDLVTHSKREYKKNSSVDKPLNSDTVLRSKKPRNNEGQLRSSNPMLQVQMVNESDFFDQPKSQPAPVKSPQASKKSPTTSAFTEQANFDGQIVLKAPKYKYTPKADGDLAYNRKKQYVKSQNTTEKYLYQGIKTHRENQFVSCFGCSKPAFKTYQSEN